MFLSFCYSVEMTITYITWSIFHGTKPSLAMSNFAANTEQGSAGSVVELAWIFCGLYIYWIVDYHPITMDLSVLLIIIINFKSPCSIPVI